MNGPLATGGAAQVGASGRLLLRHCVSFSFEPNSLAVSLSFHYLSQLDQRVDPTDVTLLSACLDVGGTSEQYKTF